MSNGITRFPGYTKHVVYKMTHKGDCGNEKIAVPLQQKKIRKGINQYKKG